MNHARFGLPLRFLASAPAFALIVGAGLVAGCNLLNLAHIPGADTVTPQTRLPETSSALVSTMVAPDRLTFTYAAPPSDVHFEPGQVLVGQQGGGYLRKVRSVEASGATLVVLTDDAVITDAIANQTVSMSIDPAAQPGCANCGKISLLDVSGSVLVNTTVGGVPVKVTLTHAVAELEPSIDFDLAIAKQHLDRLAVTIKGTLTLTLDIKAEVGGAATLQQEVDLSGPDATLLSYSFVFAVPTPIGPLPVTGTLEVDAFAGFNGKVSASGSLTTGIEGKSSFQLRAAWENGQWSIENEPTFDGMIHRPQLQTLLASELRAYVRPEVRARFYGVAGPRASVTPSLKAVIAAMPPAAPTVTLDGCITGQVGFDAKLFGFELVDLTHDFPEACRSLLVQ